MNTTAEQRAIKNTFVGFVSFIVSFLQSILLVPIILNTWGTEKYGNWLALFAGFTLLQTLDLGHQNYIGNEINIFYHKSKSDLQKILSSSLLIAWVIGFVELLLTIYLIFSGNLSSFLGTDVNMFNLNEAILVLVLMWFIFGSVSGILIRLLIPVGKFHEQQWITIIIRLSQFVALLIVVLIKGNILTAAILYSIIQSVATIIVLLYLKKIIPEFFPWWKGGSINLAFKNFYKSLVLTINNILNQLSLNGLILFVSNFYQVALIPVYTTIRTLTNTAGSLTNIFTSAINPDLVKYYSKNEDHKIYSSLFANLFISGFIVNNLLIVSFFFIEPLYNYWTNSKLGFSFSLYAFLGASVSLSNYGAGLVNYFFGSNKLRPYTMITIVKCFSLFLISFLLVNENQLYTIGISVAFSELLATVILSIYFMRTDKIDFFNEGRKEFLIISIIPSLVIISLAVITYLDLLSMLFLYLTLLFNLLVYYVGWRILDIQIKDRLIGIISRYFKRN